MTMVINETYVGWRSLWRYAINRFLRIYSLYWLASGLTIIGIILIPHAFGGVNPAIKFPSDPGLWFCNITLFSMVYSPVRLVPPAWSLTVECFFYIALGLVLARGRIIAITWFALSVAYTVYMIIEGYKFGDRYYPIPAASLFFSVGALLYHVRLPRLQLLSLLWCILLLVFSAFPIIVSWLGGDRHMLGYYGATLLFVVVFIGALSRSLPLSRDTDRLFGDLAYPVFLLHYFSVGLVRAFTRGLTSPQSLTEAALVVAVTLALALLVNRHFDPMVNRLRNDMRRAPKPIGSAYLPVK